jgi:PTH1 family peptidyl-tRNA hydrolase
VKQLQMSPDAIVVIHDDLEREFGKVAIKEGGSAGYAIQPALIRHRMQVIHPTHARVAHEWTLPGREFCSGHNGVRSTIASLQTSDFRRLRIGIGRPAHDDIAAYVLSPFSRDELHQLETTVFPLALAALLPAPPQPASPALPQHGAGGSSPSKERVNR